MLEQGGKLSDVVWTDDEVNLGQALDELLPFLLRHAASHADQKLRAPSLQHPKPPHLAAQLLFSLFSDAAGIQQNHVRLLGIELRTVAGRFEYPRHALRIVHVHLTAESDDSVGGHRQKRVLWVTLAKGFRRGPCSQ